MVSTKTVHTLFSVFSQLPRHLKSKSWTFSWVSKMFTLGALEAEKIQRQAGAELGQAQYKIC